MTVTVAGTIDTFDTIAYEAGVRSLLSCNAPLCQVSVAVTAASVNVEATVTDTTGGAVALAEALETTPIAELSARLGVAVETAPVVSAPIDTILTLAVPASPASPPPSPPPSSPSLVEGDGPQADSTTLPPLDNETEGEALTEETLGGATVGGIVAGCVLLVLAGGVVYFVMKRRGNVAANTAVTLEGVVAGAPDDDEVGKQFVGPPHARAAAAAKTDKHDFV